MSANFEPNQNEYKNLTPFKNWLLLQINTWGMTNFPFVESDFDELTNYGMMQKLMGAVNDVIANENLVEQDMTNMFNAFTELQTYVNDYFDNLDVQDEINAKLDSMAEDGSLTALIKRYIDPIIDEQDARIDSIANAISSVANGSPAGVYSTLSDLQTADPDHDRIYVVSANGHWYYYNGTQWSDGGVYQASVDDDDVALLKRNESSNIKNLYEQVNFNLNAFDGKYSHDFYSAQTGEYTSENTKYISNVNLIPLNSATKIDYEIPANESNPIVGIFMLFYNNDTFISFNFKSTAGKYTINVPENANKLRFEIGFTNNIDIEDSTNIIIHTTSEEDVRTKFENMKTISAIANDINKSQKFIGENVSITKEVDCKHVNGNLVDLTSLGLRSYHATINVEEFEYYNIIASGSIYYPPFLIYDADDNLLATYYTISGDDRTGSISINYNVQMPKDASYMIINTFYNYIVLSSLTIKNVGLNTMPKSKYIAFGDSVCKGNHPDATKSVYAWPEMFGQIHNLETQNLANGGQGFLNTQYYQLTALETIQATDISNANLITLSFGINDAGNQSITIGNVNDTGQTTICGMLYNCINYIITTNPKCQLVVTGTTKQGGYFGTRLKEINDKMQLVCEKYGIAFLNTYDQPINQWNGSTGGSLTSDGTHFNDDGYLLISQFMCGKLGSFYGLE